MKAYDIEKAYPRACREALWELMELWGADTEFIRICRALHEHTWISVKVAGGLSAAYLPERGLREGCPSSPTLFNCFHNAVLIDFKKRRALEAESNGMIPGLPWTVMVDGKLMRENQERVAKRNDLKERTMEVVIGEVVFADDTAIFGDEREIVVADQLWKETTADWDEKLNEGKTETMVVVPGSGGGLRGGTPKDFGLRGDGTVGQVRHVGGWLREDGTPEGDTSKRIAAAWGRVAQVAKAWGFKTKYGRRGGAN